ncbi:MAG: tetratricopeptide repeat protein [Chloroflexota bacterium]
MNASPYRDNDHAFGQTMLTLRSAIGLSQIELSDFLGVSRRTVGAWESGSKYPKTDNLKPFIELAVERHAFPIGREAEDIRALWKAAHIKVLLDESWVSSLLKTASHESLTSVPTETEQQPKPVFNLSIPSNQFIGRDAELVEIIHLLHDPKCRLLTLLGPGGIGKTRLALEITSRQIDAFKDGAAFVGLAPISTPAQIVAAIGDALNLSFAGQPDPRAYLLRYLRGQRMLLVLDNFEHLIEGAEIVLDILQYNPHIVILVTSRERLNVRSEWLFDVQGLSYPLVNAAETSQNLADYSAIKLFMERAAQIQSGVPPTEASLTTIMRICQHVAGMPLAIELAAAGLRILPIGKIEQQIRSNLDALSTTLRDVPARHRSMRAVIDHSWNLLSEPEHALFSRLAVFRGGCTVEAAQQITGAGLSELLALVDKSLLRQNSVQMQTTGQIESRFFLLEPIREYALEKLAARSERDQFQHAHAAYYLALTEALTAQWDTPTAETALEQVDYEHDNLFAVHQWAVNGGARAIAFNLGAALARYWRNRGTLTEGRLWMAELLAHNDDPSDTTTMTARMDATRWAAWLASDQQDFDQAERLLAESTALHQKLGIVEDKSDAHLLIVTGLQARTAGQYRRATRLLEEALAQHRAQGNHATAGNLGIGLSFQVLGGLLREQCDFVGAQTMYEACFQLHGQLGDREGMIAAMLGLGDICRDQGDAAGARHFNEQALAIASELRMQWAIGFSLNNLAQAAALAGDLEQASDWSLQSVALFRDIDAGSSLAEVLITQGNILRAQAEMPEAQKVMLEALRLVSIHGPRLLLATALEGFASVLIHMGHPAATVQFLSAASHLRAEMGAPMRPIDRVVVEAAQTMAQSTLGEQAFLALWSSANEQPLEQILNIIGTIEPLTSPQNL